MIPKCPPDCPALTFLPALPECSLRLVKDEADPQPEAQHSTLTCSQNLDQPGVSALITLCYSENLFDQGQEQTCNYGHTYSERNLRTCPSSKTGSRLSTTSPVMSFSMSTKPGMNSVLWSSPQIQPEITWLPL